MSSNRLGNHDKKTEEKAEIRGLLGFKCCSRIYMLNSVFTTKCALTCEYLQNGGNTMGVLMKRGAFRLRYIHWENVMNNHRLRRKAWSWSFLISLKKIHHYHQFDFGILVSRTAKQYIYFVLTTQSTTFDYHIPSSLMKRHCLERANEMSIQRSAQGTQQLLPAKWHIQKVQWLGLRIQSCLGAVVLGITMPCTQSRKR